MCSWGETLLTRFMLDTFLLGNYLLYSWLRFHLQKFLSWKFASHTAVTAVTVPYILSGSFRFSNCRRYRHLYGAYNQQQMQYRRSIFFLGDFDTRLLVRLRVELLTSDWCLVKDAFFSGYSRIRILGIDANSNLLRSIWFLDMHRTPQQNERDSLLLRIA